MLPSAHLATASLRPTAKAAHFDSSAAADSLSAKPLSRGDFHFSLSWRIHFSFFHPMAFPIGSIVVRYRALVKGTDEMYSRHALVIQ